MNQQHHPDPQFYYQAKGDYSKHFSQSQDGIMQSTLNDNAYNCPTVIQNAPNFSQQPSISSSQYSGSLNHIPLHFSQQSQSSSSQNKQEEFSASQKFMQNGLINSMNRMQSTTASQMSLANNLSDDRVHQNQGDYYQQIHRQDLFSSQYQISEMNTNQQNMKEENNSSSSDTSSPLIKSTEQQKVSTNNKFNEVEEDGDDSFGVSEIKKANIKRRSSESSSSSSSSSSQSLNNDGTVQKVQKKKRISKEEKNMIMNRLRLIPSYKILPIDYDDLPMNEFHLYNDILICLQDPKQLNQFPLSSQSVISKNSKQINFIFQWKYINQMCDTKRELIFHVSNKTETKKDFDSIIKILKIRNQYHELGRLLIEAESRIAMIQNTIRDSFNLMRQNGLMDLYQERRQLFERKCEFFLKEVSSQKKYMYVKSYYNEEKCEIEDTEMGVSSNLVELLTCSEVSLMIYKIMRGNYPEIFGNKLRDLWSKQSVMRLLNFESNNYNEFTLENMELTTMDGFIFPATMTVKRVQFKYDQIYANLPLQDKFLYIEFNISPKVIQQINKMRREITSTIPQQLGNTPCQQSEHKYPTSTAQQAENQKTQTSIRKESEQITKQEDPSKKTINNDQNDNKNNNTELLIESSDLNKEKENNQSTLNKFNVVIDQGCVRVKSNSDLFKGNKKMNAFNTIKSKKRKQRGFIEENEKDFYYEMQSQVFLDKFYDYLEIQELYKQSEQDNPENPTVSENQQTKNPSNSLAA